MVQEADCPACSKSYAQDIRRDTADAVMYAAANLQHVIMAAKKNSNADILSEHQMRGPEWATPSSKIFHV